MPHPTELEIEALHNGMLSNEKASESLQHIEHCPECSARFNELRNLDALIKDVETQTQDDGYFSELPNRIRERAARSAHPYNWRRVAGDTFWAIIEMAAMFILVCLASLCLSSGMIAQGGAAMSRANAYDEVEVSAVVSAPADDMKSWIE